MKTLLPEFFADKTLTTEEISKIDVQDENRDPSDNAGSTRSAADGEENPSECVELHCPSNYTEIKLIRIQGIEPKLEIPFSWVVNNLHNPEHFLHICLYVKVSPVNNL